MARSKKTNHAKVKCWKENMICDFEGTIAGASLWLFSVCEDADARGQILSLMQDHHANMLEKEKVVAGEHQN